MKIPVYIVHLPSRKDRKKHILKQFKNKKEYFLNIVTPVRDALPNRSLCYTFQKIAAREKENDSDFFIFCEDDHAFTEDYSYELIRKKIKEAISLQADILSGGVSWFQTAMYISESLFWINLFSGTQFTVVFKKFYNKIIQANFTEKDTIDHKISLLSENIFIIFPFISTQKEFGYSDVTPINNSKHRVDKLFAQSKNLLKLHTQIINYYKVSKISKISIPESDDIVIPTYIINLKERTDRLYTILQQFKDKREFEINIIDGIKHEIGAIGLWKSFCKCIQKAIDNDEDFVLICEDDHLFTDNYNKKDFLKNIIDAYVQRADILSGGIGGFGYAIPITKERYWVDWFWCTQFIIVFKSMYKKILDYDFKEGDTTDGVLSALTTNKMVLYPFISIQKDFGYSDVTKSNNELADNITQHFINTDARLSIYKKVYETYLMSK